MLQDFGKCVRINRHILTALCIVVLGIVEIVFLAKWNSPNVFTIFVKRSMFFTQRQRVVINESSTHWTKKARLRPRSAS